MTTNVKLDLYKAVKKAVDSVPVIRNVVKYNSQDDDYAQENQRNMPIAYIYFPEINWQENMLSNGQFTNEQKGDINIAIRLNLNFLKDTDAEFEKCLEVVDAVYRAVSLIKGDGFNSIVRLSEQDFIDNTNVRVWETIYKVMVIEKGAINKEKLTQVQLQVNR